MMYIVFNCLLALLNELLLLIITNNHASDILIKKMKVIKQFGFLTK